MGQVESKWRASGGQVGGGVGSRQAGFVVVVIELADDAKMVGVVGGEAGIMQCDGGEVDAVEGGGFDHGVVGHVGEQQFVADGQGRVEGVVADDIASEASHAAEAIGVFGIDVGNLVG